MLGYHELESRLKKSQRAEEDLQARLRDRIKGLEEYDQRNHGFLKKTAVILGEYRQDYRKLVNYLLIKNTDMDSMNANSNYKQEVIGKLEEKLLTVYTLEYKIKDIYNTHLKEMDNIDKNYKEKMMESMNPYISQKNLLKRSEDNSKWLNYFQERVKEDKNNMFKFQQKHCQDINTL